MKNAPRKPPENISRIPKNQSPNLNDIERKVQIGFRPIGGRAVAWTVGVILSLFTSHGNGSGHARLPDPHYHWCVLVGDYYHQVQITNGLIWYENDKTSWKDGWSVFEVGSTKFNDAAIADAAIKTVLGMPENYDLWNNNCHHFVFKLLEHICLTDEHWQRLGTKNYHRHRRASSAARLFAEGGPLHNNIVVKRPQSAAAAMVGRAEDTMAAHTPRVTTNELRTASQTVEEDGVRYLLHQ